MTFEEFDNNIMVKQAVERNIEIIGEACSKLPREFMEKHAGVEWYKAIGMRNLLIHGYFSVDVPMLGNTITKVIPVFKQHVQNILPNA